MGFLSGGSYILNVVIPKYYRTLKNFLRDAWSKVVRSLRVMTIEGTNAALMGPQSVLLRMGLSETTNWPFLDLWLLFLPCDFFSFL